MGVPLFPSSAIEGHSGEFTFQTLALRAHAEIMGGRLRMFLPEKGGEGV